MRGIAPALAAGLVLSVSTASHAQIVNVLGQVKDGEDGWAGQLALALGFKAGNTSVVQAKGELGISLKYGDHLGYLIARAEVGTRQPIHKLSWSSLDKDFVYISRVFEHLRYRYTILEWLMAEAYAQHEADRFRDLGTRVVVGVGPRVRWQLAEPFGLALGAAYMFEHEQYNTSLLESATSHRLSSYVQADLALTDVISLQNTTFLQPRFAGDSPVIAATGEVIHSHLRLYSESTLLLRVNSWLAVNVTFRATYNSTPPPQPEDLVGEGASAHLVPESERKVQQLDLSFDTTFMFTW